MIPKTLRDVLRWPDGTTLVVEQNAQSIVLSPVKRHFPLTRSDEVRGCMAYKGPALSLEEIDRRVAVAFSKKWKQENP